MFRGALLLLCILLGGCMPSAADSARARHFIQSQLNRGLLKAPDCLAYVEFRNGVRLVGQYCRGQK
jgi:hypothetical protein